MKLTPIRQEHPYGCVIACLAMLTGATYERVYHNLAIYEKPDGLMFGIDFRTADEYLADHGFAVARRFRSRWGMKVPRDPWPCAPWSSAHLCCVRIGHMSHAVVMLADASVVDPLSPLERWSLLDYDEVDNIAAVFHTSRMGEGA